MRQSSTVRYTLIQNANHSEVIPRTGGRHAGGCRTFSAALSVSGTCRRQMTFRTGRQTRNAGLPGPDEPDRAILAAPVHTMIPVHTIINSDALTVTLCALPRRAGLRALLAGFRSPALPPRQQRRARTLPGGTDAL